MRIRLCKGVFVRVAKDECIIWCPRTSGCSVLRNAAPFLRLIGRSWHDVDEIVRTVAMKFGCDVDDVASDFVIVRKELVAQGFAECQDDGSVLSMSDELKTATAAKFDDWQGLPESPLRQFCLTHGVPYELHLDLTDACSERCVHCYVPKDRHHFLPYGLAEKVLREFRMLGGFSVQLTGGECMLHPDFRRICSLCVELNLNVIILSNLTCCDDGMALFLKDLDPQYVNVSVYSMDEHEHDSITQLPGSWGKTMSAILRLKELGVHMRIATPLLKLNKSAFGKIKKFADELHVHFVPSYDIVAQSNHDCRNLDYACTAGEVRQVMASNKDIFNRGWSDEIPACNEKVCGVGETMLFVNSEGYYYPCDSMHGYVLGNARANRMDDIWTGDKFNYLRSLKNSDFPQCVQCANRPYCKLCIAANFNATGNLFAVPEGQCALAAAIRSVFGAGGAR